MRADHLINVSRLTAAAILSVFTLFMPISVLADGDEVLQTPTDPDIVTAINAGNKIRISGTGLHSLPEQPGVISITVNEGETIERALLYWQVFDVDSQFDTSLQVVRDDGNMYDVFGTIIGTHVNDSGTQDLAFYDALSATIRADITDLLRSGGNTFSITGLDDISLPPGKGDDGKNGAGILLIYSDGSSSTVQLVDGHDAGWWGGVRTSNDNLTYTRQVRFDFEATDSERFADLSMFVASVEGTVQSGTMRHSVVEIQVGDDPADLTRDIDALTSSQGDEWDDYVRNVRIPAGADYIEIQILSERGDGAAPDPNNGNNPASFVWLAAGISVPQEVENACECRPKVLTFKYIGGSCDASNNDQGDKFSCYGNLNGADNVDIEVTSNKRRRSGIELSSNEVTTGQEFSLISNAVGGQRGRLPAQSKILLSDGDDSIFLDIHTSCSVPLATGDQFGPLVLVGFEEGNQCSTCSHKDKRHDKKKKRGKKHKKGHN
ncbi:DUF7467 domain-containing protein [Ferrimonas lipolytica]|uniref:DUF7467 domain-containing protein n=1 Tax=Ferrimonas lipolytica TaxID=2724191 RepID=A0A6H1UCL6_9GAMM|nr:hypothetical protein [Ferrimonas lipolytica]QIZ76847.1 hypothetical protein HER31_08135 [Ferrimonas lipolytica]